MLKPVDLAPDEVADTRLGNAELDRRLRLRQSTDLDEFREQKP